MTPVVAQARKQVEMWIGILTVGGIVVLSFYSAVLIPTITLGLVVTAVGWAMPPTLSMIAVHRVLMNRRWRKAEAFLSGEGGEPVSAEDALEAMLDFPSLMPLFGLLAWVAGGLGAVFGSYWGTAWKLKASDAVTLYIGIVSGAFLITIFQFYMWRHIIDPVVGLIIHRAPEVLDKKLAARRTPLNKSLLLTLIPLICLALFMAEMAGYKQAANVLQNWVGESNMDHVEDYSDSILWTSISDPGYRGDLLARLREYEKQSKNNVYLIELRKDGYFEYVRDEKFLDLFPKVVMSEIENRLEAARDKKNISYQFNPFGPEINVVKKINVGAGESAATYFLVFGYPWEHFRPKLNYFIFISMALMGIVVLISVGVVWVISRDISEPVARLVEFTEQVGEGKIHRDVFFHANDEVGDLALSLRGMSGRLGEVLNRIQAAASSLDLATSSIRQAVDSVKDSSRLQEQSVEDVSGAMSDMDTNIQSIADNVEVLSASAEESSSSIFEMGAAIKKINESVDILNQSISNVSSSINEMTAALDQVAENVGNLSALSEETASSMGEMDASIREIEQNAKDTANWSESVIKDAEEGVDAVSRVNTGMQSISEVVHAAQTVIERLGQRVLEIGKIVQVIDDVANQTNLLALNAAIIAAQAGEHGRGFAVVADEIKQLAERTSGSTREIHQLIRGVQEESREAVGAVEQGARAVEDGVRVVEQASGSLAKIRESTRLATERVQEIAQTTVQQAESSRQVSKAIDQVADMINQISVATQQQSKGGSLILKSTEEMKSASLQVKRNAEEQLQGSRLITKSIENITDMLYSINQAQQEQKKGSSQVVQLMDRIKVASQQGGESGRRLADVVNALTQEADTLKEEIKRFQLLSPENNGPDQNS
ncbi:MAG TPA: methyl-accepting chemotaxis protein [bacterium]|nr:methyl-accepting chemotaxis protein [bacterium]